MNYTVKDTLGILTASAALAPVMFPPGYAIGWALNLFEFRQRRPVLKLILAVPLTIAITPILVYLAASFAPVLLWIFYGSSAVVCAWLLARDAHRFQLRGGSKLVWGGLALVAGWVIVAIASLVDLQLGPNLYLPIPAYDHAIRVEMLGAIARHMPPSNPFFANPDVPLRYHYLWILLISFPLKLGRFALRDLTYAGVVWCGIGLICLVPFTLKFLANAVARIEQKALLAVLLLGVTGLDLLPTLYMAAVDKTWQADMEWWNDVQISSWASSMLWVPHNLAALVACIVGFVLLRRGSEDGGSRKVSVIVAGICFASAAGLSLYVAFTFVVGVGLWMLAAAARKDWPELLNFAAAGIIAAIVALPFLKSISGPGAGSDFVEFALRPFPLGVHLAAKLGFAMKSGGAIAAVNALGLPFNYLLELGLFLVVAVIRLRHLKRGVVQVTRDEVACWVLVATSFLIGTFLRSGTIETNDLGTRCFLPAQLVLLLWAAIYADDWFFAKTASTSRPGRWTKAILAACLVLGILGTSYEVFMLRFFPVFKDRGEIAGVMLLDNAPQAGRRTYALRSLYEKLNSEIAPTAVIQDNPISKNYVTHAIYSGHPYVAGGPGCGVVFGGTKEACFERLGRLFLLYEDPNDDPASACRPYGIDVVVVEDTDPVWMDRNSWVWRDQPLAANEYARAFQCRTTDMGAAVR